MFALLTLAVAHWRHIAASPVLLLALSAPVPHPRILPHPLAAVRVPPAVPQPVPAMVGFLDFHVSGRRPADLDSARAINARIPIANAPARIAPPFFLSGTTADQARAIDCLAAAGHYEAGNDPGGQRSVIQVVLNRVRNPAYPQTICGVVFQGAERRTGCQFTFTCDGAMTRHRPSPFAWARARQTALAALNGSTDARVGHATHYHTDWVHPYWSASLDKVAAVDTHLFFQPRARAPGNFTAPYAGGEPRIARLAWLSAAHLPDASSAYVTRLDPAAVAVVVAATVPSAIPAAPVIERLPARTQPPEEGTFLVTLDAAAHPDNFRRLAEKRCAGLSACKFIGWTDPARRVDQFPLPGRAIDAIAFSYSRSGPGSTIRAQWDCHLFPRAQPDECLRRSAPDSST